MATYNKFNCFVEDLDEKVHNLGSDTLRMLLTNDAPNAADTVVDTTTATCTVTATSNAAEVAAASGYSKKGPAVTITASSQTGGTYTLVGNNVVVTAGADIGPFQYVVLYNDSAGAAAARPVIGWWNYGSSITLHNGDTFTVSFTAVSGVIITVV